MNISKLRNVMVKEKDRGIGNFALGGATIESK
jgi:hypothetical protein